MAIQSDDLGIYKSAVMADVPEGGGGLTGDPVVDGLSNAIFPDVSDDNRASGAFHLRKIGGKVNTDNTDLLLGTGWVVLKPPTDSAVEVTLFETGDWFDERTDAIKLVESTMVKGPRMLCRIQDTHYAGVSLLQLYNVAPAKAFPAAGDAVVLRNPDGNEIKVRVLKVTESQTVVFDASGEYAVNLSTCELSKPLAFDILGAPVQRTPPNANGAATVFSTAPAVGARFHAVKPLATAVTLGAQPIREVSVSGGIFAQLVPASTVPTPVVDQLPMLQRPTLSRTASGTLSLTTGAITLTAGTVLRTPTAIEPASLTMQHGTTTFTTNNAGQLLQGGTVVGSVDWAGRTLSMLGTAPNYGSATNTQTYKPATVTGATAHSIAIEVTDANRSTALVQALEPPPAPGTLTVSYMPQGRWFDLVEDGTGKLSGADASYGAGTLSFVTGSLAATLGAMPDVGSAIVLTWGEADSAVPATGLPARAWTKLPLEKQPQDGTLVIIWPTSAGTQTASVNAAGGVTGPAQVKPVERVSSTEYLLPFSPDVLPTGPVTVHFQAAASTSAFSNDGGGQYTLSQPPAPGSVRFTVVGTNGSGAKSYKARTSGTNVLVGSTLIGQINNATGVITLNGAASINETNFVKTRHEALRPVASSS